MDSVIKNIMDDYGYLICEFEGYKLFRLNDSYFVNSTECGCLGIYYDNEKKYFYMDSNIDSKYIGNKYAEKIIEKYTKAIRVIDVFDRKINSVTE